MEPALAAFGSGGIGLANNGSTFRLPFPDHPLWTSLYVTSTTASALSPISPPPSHNMEFAMENIVEFRVVIIHVARSPTGGLVGKESTRDHLHFSSQIMEGTACFLCRILDEAAIGDAALDSTLYCTAPLGLVAYKKAVLNGGYVSCLNWDAPPPPAKYSSTGRIEFHAKVHLLITKPSVPEMSCDLQILPQLLPWSSQRS